jgi:hypothetical protein
MSSEEPRTERDVFQDRYFVEEEIANTHLRRLEEAAALPYGEEQRSRIMAETVLASAHVSRETTYLQLLAGKGNQRTISGAIDAVQTSAHTLVERLEVSTKALTEQIKDFTTKADEGTRLLAKWTMWLAVATIFLVLATGGLVYVEWSHGHEAPYQGANR